MEQRQPKPTDKPADMAVKRGSGLVVEIRPSQVWQGVTYQLAYNKQAGDGRSKNPYWRAYWWDAEGGRTRSKYIGLEFRELTEEDFS